MYHLTWECWFMLGRDSRTRIIIVYIRLHICFIRGLLFAPAGHLMQLRSPCTGCLCGPKATRGELASPCPLLSSECRA
jgi:hypothetical protein